MMHRYIYRVNRKTLLFNALNDLNEKHWVKIVRKSSVNAKR